MIDCLRMQIKLSPYGSIGATRGEDKTKTLRMYFCHKCYPFNYSWKHLESDLEINFFCFLPFWNEKSLNAWFPMTYFNLTEKFFFCRCSCWSDSVSLLSYSVHGHHGNCNNRDCHDHHDYRIMTWLFQERYHLSLAFIDSLNTGH